MARISTRPVAHTGRIVTTHATLGNTPADVAVSVAPATSGPSIPGAQLSADGQTHVAPILRQPMLPGPRFDLPALSTERYVRMVLTNYSVTQPAAVREVRFLGGWNFRARVTANALQTVTTPISSTTDRYVRITFTRRGDDAGAPYAHLAVVEVTAGTMPTPVAKSPDETWMTQVPANVVDGNTGTWWQAPSTAPNPQLIIDRGAGAPAFTSVVIRFYGDPQYYGIDYTIETLPTLPTASTPDPTAGGVHPGSNAVDNDFTTTWQPETSSESPFSATPYAHHLVIDRGVGAPPFNAIEVDWFDATYRGYDWTWEASDDLTTWRTATTVVGNTAATTPATPAAASTATPIYVPQPDGSPPTVPPDPPIDTLTGFVSDAWSFGQSGDAITDIVEATGEDVLSEPGNGSITLLNDNPALGTTITMPPDKFNPQVITLYVNDTYAFAFVIEKSAERTVDDETGTREATALMGRGVLCLLERGVLYPLLGVLAEPVEDDIQFDWTHPLYNDSFWPAAHLLTYIIWVIPPPFGLWDPNAWPRPWNAAYPDHSGPVLAPVGATNLNAPAGDIYFRDTGVNLPTKRRYAFFGIGDNIFECFLDGAHTLTSDEVFGDQTDSADSRLAQVIQMEAGGHTFAGKLSNAPNGSLPNPTGAAASLWIPGYAPNGPYLMWHLDASSKMLAYPASEPGMTPSEIINICLNEVHDRGAVTQIWTNAGASDANGDPFVITPGVATKVGNDLLTFFREMAGTHIDIAVRAGGELKVWLFGKMGASLSVELDVGEEIVTLDHDSDAGGANVILARWAGGWAEIGGSTFSGDRVEALLGLGAQADLQEVTTKATQQISESSRVGEQATLTYEITAGTVPFVDYKVGDSILVPTSGGGVARHRVLALAFQWKESDGRLLAIPTVARFLT